MAKILSPMEVTDYDSNFESSRLSGRGYNSGVDRTALSRALSRDRDEAEARKLIYGSARKKIKSRSDITLDELNKLMQKVKVGK